MAGTIQRTEPVRLTRASLIGVTFRIGKVYGPTVIGVRVYLSYHASKGCMDSLASLSLARAAAAGRSGFQPTNSDARPCSASYYERRALSWQERERREAAARIERGERFGMRQAS